MLTLAIFGILMLNKDCEIQEDWDKVFFIAFYLCNALSLVFEFDYVREVYWLFPGSLSRAAGVHTLIEYPSSSISSVKLACKFCQNYSFFWHCWLQYYHNYILWQYFVLAFVPLLPGSFLRIERKAEKLMNFDVGSCYQTPASIHLIDIYCWICC